MSRGRGGRRDAKRQDTAEQDKSRGIAATVTLTIQQVQDILEKEVVPKCPEQDRELAKVWVEKACEHYFQVPKTNSARNTRQRNGHYRAKSRGRGGRGSSSGSYAEKQHHRQVIKISMVPSFGGRFPQGGSGHEDHSVEKLISRCKRVSLWESEKELSKLQWPELFDPVSLEKFIAPMKKVSGESITYTEQQSKKIALQGKRPPSLKVHVKKRTASEINADWVAIGEKLQTISQSAVPEYHLKYEQLWQQLLDRVDEFATSPELDKCFEDLSKALLDVTAENEANEKGLNELWNSSGADAQVLDNICQSFNKFVQTQLSTQVVVAVEKHAELVESLVDQIWTATLEVFKANTPEPKPGSKPQHPPRTQARPDKVVVDKIEKLAAEIVGRCTKAKDLLSGKDESGKENLKSTIESCTPRSYQDLVQSYLAQLTSTVDKYTCNQLRSLAVQVQRLSDQYSRSLENDLISTKWKELMQQSMDCRLEYSWNLKYGISLLMSGIATLMPTDPTPTPAPQVPRVPPSTARTVPSARPSTTTDNNQQQPARSKPKVNVSAEPSRRKPPTQAAATNGVTPRPVPTTPTNSTLSYSQVTTQASTIRALTEDFDKKMAAVRAANEAQVAELREELDTKAARWEEEKESLIAQLREKRAQLQQLKNTLKGAEAEIEAQRASQEKLKEVVKELMDRERQPQPQPVQANPMGYYQHQHMVMVHPQGNGVMNYAQAHHPYHLQHQHQQMYSSEQNLQRSFQHVQSTNANYVQDVAKN